MGYYSNTPTHSLCPLRNPASHQGKHKCRFETSIERGSWIGVKKTNATYCTYGYGCRNCLTKEIICGSTHGMVRCIWIIYWKQQGFPLILRLWSPASISMLTVQAVCCDWHIKTSVGSVFTYVHVHSRIFFHHFCFIYGFFSRFPVPPLQITQLELRCQTIQDSETSQYGVIPKLLWMLWMRLIIRWAL